MGLRAWDVARMLLVLAVVVAGFLLVPSPEARAAEPLPPGSYVVAVDSASFALWIGQDGDAIVTGGAGLVVELQRDGQGRVLDQLSVSSSRGGSFAVEIDASRPDLYLTSVERVDAEVEEPVVAVRDRDDRTTPPSEGESEGEEAGERLFEPGPNPMADRVNGVAEALVRGADGMRGMARGLGDLVDPRDEAPGQGRRATPATPATPAQPQDGAPAQPATPAQPAGSDRSDGPGGQPRAETREHTPDGNGGASGQQQGGRDR